MKMALRKVQCPKKKTTLRYFSQINGKICWLISF